MNIIYYTLHVHYTVYTHGRMYVHEMLKRNFVNRCTRCSRGSLFTGARDAQEKLCTLVIYSNELYTPLEELYTLVIYTNEQCTPLEVGTQE